MVFVDPLMHVNRGFKLKNNSLMEQFDSMRQIFFSLYFFSSLMRWLPQQHYYWYMIYNVATNWSNFQPLIKQYPTSLAGCIFFLSFWVQSRVFQTFKTALSSFVLVSELGRNLIQVAQSYTLYGTYARTKGFSSNWTQLRWFPAPPSYPTLLNY